ncbi:MAG: SCP2 sterol-binding domain-containing protein [Candidatus Scalinduaceae bacterium]
MMNNKFQQMIETKPGNYEKRPEITHNTTHVEYFEELMFDRVNMCPLPKIESLNTAIRFDIVGHNAGSWTIIVEDGLLKGILRNYLTPCSPVETKYEFKGYHKDNAGLLSEEVTSLPVPSRQTGKPICIFRLDGHTFMSIVRREITPQQAFFKKEVQIEGDITLALKMNVLVNYL